MFQTSYVFRTFHPPFSSLLPHPLGDTPLPPVLIAPLFAIFVLREALSVVTRERKKEKKGRRGMEESEGRRKIYSQPSPVRSSSPLHSGEHFATVSVTRCTFLLARVLAYCLSLSLFRVRSPLFTTLIVLRVWLQTSRALSLLPRMQFLRWLFIKKWISFVQLIYLIIGWNIYLFFTLFREISVK